MPTDGKTNGTPLIAGAIPDMLLDAGKRPAADPSKEYLSSGGADFPLMQQVVLSKGGDDLERDLGIQVYEGMDKESTVRSTLGVLISGFLAGDIQILPAIVAGEGERAEEMDPARSAEIEEAKAAAEFCKRSADRLTIPLETVMWDLYRGALKLGCKLAEKVFEPGDGEDSGKLVWKTLRPKRREAWDFVVAPSGETVAIRGLTFEAGLADLPPEKFLILSWMPTDGDPRGRSILRGAYNGWNLKINTWEKYFKYLDKFATPSLIATAADNAPNEPAVDDRGNPTGEYWTATEALFYALQRFEGGAAAVFPPGTTVTVLQSQGNGEAFQSALRLFKQEIVEGILLTARSIMESQRNSKADADQAQDTVGQLIRFGKKVGEGLLRRHGFHQLLELNNGLEYANKYTPIVSFGSTEQQDITKMLTALAGVGYALDPSQFPAIDARNGFPVREEASEDEQGEGESGSDPNEGQNDPGDDSAEFSDLTSPEDRDRSTLAGAIRRMLDRMEGRYGPTAEFRRVRKKGGGGGGSGNHPSGPGTGNPNHDRQGRFAPGHGPAADKEKFVGKAVGKKEHVFAEKNEKAIARAVGGKQLSDNEPLDVRIRNADGTEHAIEVKSLLKGSKTSISVHDDALMRKVDYAEKNPGSTFHTVAADHRGHYERGKYKADYSGHDLYYKRGSGRYALSQMHKVKDHEELKQLIHMKDHELPEKARGSLPGGEAVAKLRESAAKAHESRLNKDRARKQRLKAERQSAAGVSDGL